MHTLTCPWPVLRQILQALATTRGRSLFARMGLCATESSLEWLVRDRVPSPSEARGPLFSFVLASDPPANLIAPNLWPPGVVGQVYVGDGPWRGRLWGYVRGEHGVEPLQRLDLVGPGMHRVKITDREQQVEDGGLEISDAERERWSRTIGALGGESAWQRLTRLRVAVIGCGRSGSLAAVTLARLGVRHLILIDPDVIERHNLGEMDAVLEADMGQPKAEALADHLRSLLTAGGSTVVPLVASIADPAALAVVKGCEVLVSCPDHDAARLAAAIVAALYHRVLLDIGTDIRFTVGDGPPRNPNNPVRNRVMGADVRLILPGDGCLLCRGSLTNDAQAIDDLCRHSLPADLQREPRDWRQQRAGSLRTLNQLAVALGVQMLQDLVAGGLWASTWAHVEFDPAGRLQVTYPQPAGEPTSCPLCARAGLGDAGVAWS